MDIGEDEPQAEESWTLKLLIDTCVWLDLGSGLIDHNQ